VLSYTLLAACEAQSVRPLNSEFRMSVFAEFLRRVRVKSIKLGPVTWDILPSEKMLFPIVPEQDVALLAVTTEKAQAPAPDMGRLNDIIDSLEKFDSNPESIYYIGQTLIKCDSFLMDNGIIGDSLVLCELLINQMDSDPRIEEGFFDPRLSISKINNLKRSLKQFRDDILRFEGEA
jgi:hypothetical protein